MELLWYAVQFTRAVLRRFLFVLGPPLLLDPFDWFDQYYPDRLEFEPPWKAVFPLILFSSALFIACVLAFRDAAEGRAESIRVRRAVRELRGQNDTAGRTGGNHYEFTYEWMLHAVRDQITGPGGIDTRDYRAVTIIGPLDRQKWNRALGAFRRAQVASEETYIVPGTAKSEARWTPTPIGNAVLTHLARHPPPSPPTRGEAALARQRRLRWPSLGRSKDRQ